MKMNLISGPNRLAQNVLYYSTLALLAMPWGSHSRLVGYGLAVRLVLIVLVAAGFVLSGRGSCRA